MMMMMVMMMIIITIIISCENTARSTYVVCEGFQKKERIAAGAVDLEYACDKGQVKNCW